MRLEIGALTGSPARCNFDATRTGENPNPRKASIVMRPLCALRLALFVSVLVSCVSSAHAQFVSLSLGAGREPASARLSLGRAPACASTRVWVEGRWEIRVEQVWVEGCERRVWSPARFESRWDSCGRRVRVLVSAGRWVLVRDPGRFEQREVRVWVPGYWRNCAPRY